MRTKQELFDSKMIANLIVAIALVISAICYLNFSTEIEDEVSAVIVDTLNDVSNSLAEQGSSRK